MTHTRIALVTGLFALLFSLIIGGISHRQVTPHVIRVSSSLFQFGSSLNNNIFIEYSDPSVTSQDIQDVRSLIEQESIPVLTKNTGLQTPSALYVHLYENKEAFLQLEQQYFASAYNTDVSLNGFAMGTNAFIPLYEYRYRLNGKVQYDNADLSNFLTHELTHTLINANHIDIPTWMNEGFAWYNGMNAETKYSRSFASVLSNSNYFDLSMAAQKGQLISLNHSESDIFKEVNYNLEFEDYAAVSELIASDGQAGFQTFLKRTETELANRAYESVYHAKMKQYEQFFYDYISGK